MYNHDSTADMNSINVSRKKKSLVLKTENQLRLWGCSLTDYFVYLLNILLKRRTGIRDSIFQAIQMPSPVRK